MVNHLARRELKQERTSSLGEVRFVQSHISDFIARHSILPMVGTTEIL